MLTDPTELLFRNIHPSFIRNGEPSSQAFMPTPKDGGQLSVDRQNEASAASSFEVFTLQGFQSAGIWGVTVGECTAQELKVTADPLEDNAAHCLIDFNAHGTSQQKKRGRRLKQSALARGCLHPAPEP